MLGTDLRNHITTWCWWQVRSKTCHQHIWSPISVANIDVTQNSARNFWKLTLNKFVWLTSFPITNIAWGYFREFSNWDLEFFQPSNKQIVPDPLPLSLSFAVVRHLVANYLEWSKLALSQSQLNRRQFGFFRCHPSRILFRSDWHIEHGMLQLKLTVLTLVNSLFSERLHFDLFHDQGDEIDLWKDDFISLEEP